MTRVSGEPMMTQVAMSAFCGSAPESGNTSMRSSGRPAARPKMTGVVPGRMAARHSKARPSCHGRALLIGFYCALT
jgi:hypothetical protein